MSQTDRNAIVSILHGAAKVALAIWVTHLPSMQSVRIHSWGRPSQHKVRESALALLEMIVSEFGDTCQNPQIFESKTGKAEA